MDVIQIEKTGENFRLIYDVKGRYTIHRYISNLFLPFYVVYQKNIKLKPFEFLVACNYENVLLTFAYF